MTAFDAPIRPRRDRSSGGRALAIIAGRPAVVAAAVVAAATILWLALLSLVVVQELRAWTFQAADDVQALIYLRPQASRAAAEALQEPLEALPFVKAATLRTKEEALAVLERNGVPQLKNRSNPLPDAWIVRLALGKPDSTGKSLSDRVDAARERFARLSDVESVDIDTGWTRTLDRWQAFDARSERPGLVLLFGVVALLLWCLFFLAGRGLRGTAEPGSQPGGLDGSPSALLGAVVGVAALLTCAAFAVATVLVLDSASFDWKPIVVRAGQTSSAPIIALAIETLLLSIGATWIGARRQ